MSPVFPPGALIRRVNEEPVILFGAGRALLLQLAHPHVAAGVDEHSDFQGDPFKRLQGTLRAMYVMVWGSQELAGGVGRRIRWIHDFVTGPGYRANDPANLLWVHATLLDSALWCHDRLVRPLTPEEAETYYQEMVVVAEAFGCPRSEQPADYASFRRWWDEQVVAIEVSDTARRLARDILWPQLPLNLHVPLAPALAVQRLAAIGSLPEPVRDGFGLGWGPRRQRALERLHGAVRGVNRVVPRPLRVAPVHLNGRLLVHQARRDVARFEARLAGAGH
jgi:uncharacterized protein (DUF2236 family)